MRKIFTITILALAINAFGQVPTNGLLGYWPFNGNANDASGNGNIGTVNGATLTTDRFGNANSAYHFNGILNYIDLSNTNFTGDFTVNLWYNADTIQSYTTQNIGQKLISKFTNAKSSPNGWEIELSKGGNIGIGNAIVGGNSLNSSIINNWYFISLIYKSSTQTMTVYQNGSLAYTTTGFILVSNSVPIRLGARANATGNIFPFKGKLDDVRIFNRALDSTEISELYNESICKQSITVTDTLVINANLTGFNPVTYQNNIKVYPNPTSDAITIDCGSNFSTLTGYSIKIANSTSQTVYESDVTKQIETINLKSWTGKGVYFIYLIDNKSNTVDVKKIVLQ